MGSQTYKVPAWQVTTGSHLVGFGPVKEVEEIDNRIVFVGLGRKTKTVHRDDEVELYAVSLSDKEPGGCLASLFGGLISLLN